MYSNNWTTWWRWSVQPGANKLILNNQLQHQGLNTKKQKHKVKQISDLGNNENALTITLTETHLDEKILYSEMQMKNYIGFRADRTLSRKNNGVINYIKATEAVDAEQLIAKNLTHILNTNSFILKKTILLLLICTVIQTVLQKNLLPLEWINNETNRNRKSNARYHIYRRPELSNYWLANGNSRRWKH